MCVCIYIYIYIYIYTHTHTHTHTHIYRDIFFEKSKTQPCSQVTMVWLGRHIPKNVNNVYKGKQ